MASSSASTSRPIIIVGSGLGGLALAQSLLRQKIPFKVFERDGGAEQRAQGYRIRIREEGLAALKHCLPPDVYTRFEETCAQNDPPSGRMDAKTGEKDGALMMGAAPPGGQAPTPAYSVPADRRIMRGVLLTGLEEHVSYKKSFKSFTSSSESVKVEFADGTSAEGSFLVGADGLRSSIAKQLTGEAAKVLDFGVPMIYGKTLLTPEVEDRIHGSMKHGMSIFRDASGGHMRTLFLEAMRFKQPCNTPDYVFWVVSGHGVLSGRSIEECLRVQGSEAAKESLISSRDWHPSVRALLEHQDESQTATLRLTTSDPSGLPTWDTNPRVTILGDAIHCMPPTGGSGANTALRDASLLADMFGAAKEGGVTKEMVEKYEQDMRKWADKVVAMSCEAAVHGFGVSPLPEMRKGGAA